MGVRHASGQCGNILTLRPQHSSMILRRGARRSGEVHPKGPPWSVRGAGAVLTCLSGLREKETVEVYSNQHTAQRHWTDEYTLRPKIVQATSNRKTSEIGVTSAKSGTIRKNTGILVL